MGNPFSRFREFITTATYSQKVGLVALVIVLLALPLTVIVSRQQQQTRQEAANCPVQGIRQEQCSQYCSTTRLPSQCVPSTNYAGKYDCCYSSTTVTTTPVATTTVAPPGDQTTVKSCHVCSGTKFCGTSWIVSAGTLCGSTPPNDGTAKTNQVVCACAGGTEGSCGSETKEKVAAACGVTPGDKCTRCSDTFKFCGVKFDRNTNGTCSTGESASGKEYYVDCSCNYGNDYGTCGSASTASCHTGGTTLCDSGIVCTGQCRAKIGVCGPSEKSNCQKTKLANDPTKECTPVAAPNQACSNDITCPTGTCNTTTGQCSTTYKSCYDCNSTKFCGTTWSVPAGTLCDPTKKPSDAKTNQVVCSCTSGSSGTCGGVSTAQCEVTPGEKCTRCSDVYKFCKVTYDKSSNGQCGPGDSATGKAYSVDCSCGFGTDFGSCGGVSTVSCNTTPSPTVTASPSPSTTTRPTTTAIPTSTTNPTSTVAPTTTVTPGGSYITFTIGLDGLGTTGDQSNPNVGSGNIPLTTQRNVTVEVFKDSQLAFPAKTASIAYDPGTEFPKGKFIGRVDISNEFNTNKINDNTPYIVKVKSDGYLRRAVPPGQVTLRKGQENKLGEQTTNKINLVAGDLNNDNTITILDYNILLECWNKTPESTSCKVANMTDNNKIDYDDYTLFLREFFVEEGH